MTTGDCFRSSRRSSGSEHKAACTGKSGVVRHANMDLGPLRFQRENGPDRASRFPVERANDFRLNAKMREQIARPDTGAAFQVQDQPRAACCVRLLSNKDKG